MSGLTVREVEDGVVFTAKVVPGSASPTRVCGLLNGMLKVKVSAPPEKGKANECLIEFLAGLLGVKKNQLSIVTGQTSPLKQIKVLGITADTLLKRLDLE